jgi:hypothetical protein
MKRGKDFLVREVAGRAEKDEGVRVLVVHRSDGIVRRAHSFRARERRKGAWSEPVRRRRKAIRPGTRAAANGANVEVPSGINGAPVQYVTTRPPSGTRFARPHGYRTSLVRLAQEEQACLERYR